MAHTDERWPLALKHLKSPEIADAIQRHRVLHPATAGCDAVNSEINL